MGRAAWMLRALSYAAVSRQPKRATARGDHEGLMAS